MRCGGCGGGQVAVVGVLVAGIVFGSGGLGGGGGHCRLTVVVVEVSVGLFLMSNLGFC